MRMNAFDALWGLAQAIIRMPDLDAITAAIANADMDAAGTVCILSVPAGKTPVGAIIVATVLGESMVVSQSPDFIKWFSAALGDHVKTQPTVKVFADALELWLMSTPEGRDFKRVFSPVLVIYGTDDASIAGVYSEGQERAAIMRALDSNGNKAVDFIEIGELDKAGEFLFRTATFLSSYDVGAAREARDLGNKLNRMATRVKHLVEHGDPNGMHINVMIRDSNDDNGGSFAPLDGETRRGLEKFYLDLVQAREALATAMNPDHGAKAHAEYEAANALPKTMQTGPGWKIGEAFANQRHVRKSEVFDAETRFSPG